MNLWNAIKSVWLEKYQEYRQKYFTPKVEGHLYYDDMVQILRNNLPTWGTFQVLDNHYLIPDERDIMNFLDLNFFKYKLWLKDKFECENFAICLLGWFYLLFPGYSIGLACVKTPNGAHCLLFFIDKLKRIHYIEGQNSTIFQNSEYKPYFFMI